MEEAAESNQESDYLPPTNHANGGCQNDLFLQLTDVISSLEISVCSWRSASAGGHMADPMSPGLGSAICSTIFPSTVMHGMNQIPPVSQERDLKSIQTEISHLREQNAALRFKLMATDVELDSSKNTIKVFIDEKNRLQKKAKNLQDLLDENNGVNGPLSSPIPGVRGLYDLTSDKHISSSDAQQETNASLSTLHTLIQYLQSLPGVKPTLCGSPEVQKDNQQAELERLKGCYDFMKRLNERLSITLKECKTDSEKLSMHLGTLESACTALRLALQSSEKCLRTYSVLLALVEAKEEILLGQVAVGDLINSGWSLLPKDLEIKTKLFLMEVKKTFGREGPLSESMKKGIGIPAFDRFYAPWLSEEEEQTLKDYVRSLKFDLTSIALQEQQHMGKDRLSHSHEVSHLAEIIKTKVDNAIKSSMEASPGQHEKPLRAQILQELTDTKEGLTEIKASLQLLQTEKRALELQIACETEQERAYMLIRDQLQMGLVPREEDSPSDEKRMVYLKNASSRGEHSDQSLDLQQLLDSLTRCNDMRIHIENLTSDLEQLSSNVHLEKAQAAQVIMDFFKAHRNLFITYQNACRKYKEQQRKLDSQAGLMSQHHLQQLQSLMQTIMNLQIQKTAKDTDSF
uniref:Harmonin-binding protein USHBP1 PDZ-binding domain-containing protein n=1 Tax=Leptobrachium leishanense TaxID=445787 RepID=A0A8C5Q4D9_9ANUR